MEVIILGIVEGITEFLPISSTGHLLLVQQWLTHHQSDLFLVFIQSGAVAAVVMIFKERLIRMVIEWREAWARDYLLKLCVAFVITALGGLILHTLNFELPENPEPVAMALLIGGILFIGVERWLRGKKMREEITWPVTLMMGVAQLVAAVFPGTSRSGSTILFALIMGLNRRVAVEFSFLLGVPTLLAAGLFKLFTHYREPDPERLDWGMLILGTLVSAIVGFVAVKWLLRYLQANTFESFGWYRVALGVVILLYFLL